MAVELKYIWNCHQDHGLHCPAKGLELHAETGPILASDCIYVTIYRIISPKKFEKEG